MNNREEVICGNIGLVHSCARRFIGRGIEYDDLFQAGCMGLIKAADGFDEKRGLKFSTYAVPVILGEIRRLFRDGGAVKVSRSLKEMSMRASREREDFISREGREPTVSEMADLLGVGIEQAAEALSAAMPALSLTKAGEDEGEQLDVPVEPPDELLTDKLALQQVLCELDSLDRALIVLRYLKSNTQQATAEKLGMTQVQVSRRERAILEIMRRKLTG
ncbi:MAG TPA: sigma-70 family RNA polymerase sigma factor [Candidatus Avimonas sp.]|nr:sigma-70 family RNA polymerase sigma factor [Clostridiales bacterium]HOB36880.1 sigma-70 family RNA polymerase sigma factor [Candidatus Avimonas sp.]HQA16393.1 sigma-70 family RNA polymerase sigma factor [Candidatus Avimonas sp.]HQD37930.1 sigma-70 family RNA polymerase sigma factor [Candidatus Avimonas sp.]